MSEENNMITEDVVLTTQPRRGRPKKVDLPNITAETIETIETIEEVVVPGETITEPNVTNEIEELAETPPKSLETKVTNTKKDSKPISKCYTANYNHKVGDMVYLAHFSGKSDERLFGSILEKYMFRPFYTKVKEVLISSDNSILYRLESCQQACFRESLIADTLEECKRICDTLNR